MSTLASDPPRGIAGQYYDGLSARAQMVHVHLGVSRVHVEGLPVPLDLPVRDVMITERLGSAPRRMVLPDGASIEVQDDPLLDEIEWRQGRQKNWVAVLEGKWRHAALALLGTALVGCALYVYGLPWIADTLAQRVPHAWVVSLTESTLNTLDSGILTASRLSQTRQSGIRKAFAAWKPPEAGMPAYRLQFRRGGPIGPNALALPAGDIVVTDELVTLAHSDEELLGVLSHELGHLHHRHTVRQVLRSGLVSVAAGIWFGDLSSLAGASAAVLSLRYTRDFEQDADDYAAQMMRANRADPAALGRILSRLGQAAGEEKTQDMVPEYFQSHPLTADRIRRLNAASESTGAAYPTQDTGAPESEK